MRGYILESRTVLESEVWNKPPLYFKVWNYLLLKASHKDHGNLKRGQLFTSIDEIREACSYKVGYRLKTPSRKEIYGIIDWLRSPHEGNNEGNMIVTTKVTHGMIVTICNFNKYQNPKFYEGNKDSDTKEQREEQKGNNINKNGNKNDDDIYSQSVNMNNYIVQDHLTQDQTDRLTEYYSDPEGLFKKVNEKIRMRKNQTEIKDPYQYIRKAAKDMQWPKMEEVEKKNAQRKKAQEDLEKAAKPPELTPEQKAKAKEIRERRKNATR